MDRTEPAATHDTGAPDKSKPHLFREIDLLAGTKSAFDGKARVCGLCGRGREDRIHTGVEEEVGRWGL
jgi:hypothetical protein